MKTHPPSRLFPVNLPSRQWNTFHAAGFSRPVCGVIYRPDVLKPACGMPLGGIGTGCLDIEADGRLGLVTIFQRVWGWDRRDQVYALPEFVQKRGLAANDQDSLPFLKRRGVVVDLGPEERGPLNLPFLGLSIGQEAVVLSTEPLSGVGHASQIHYWGHYPVADLEYETSLPVGVGLRAWAPFFPGDVKRSSIPGTVFMVHVRNPCPTTQHGTLAFSFPGPRAKPGGTVSFTRHDDGEACRGVQVETPAASYALAVAGGETIRIGGELGADGAAWAQIATALPELNLADPGTSLAVDFHLEPGEEQVVRFFLTWCTAEWESEFPYGQKLHHYTNIYAQFFPDPWQTASRLAEEGNALLGRILAWQSVIYDEKGLPSWLRDQLVNLLHLISEESYWAAACPPLGDWCYQGGLFALVEGTDAAGQQCCIPCDWYGNFPLVFFFPELAWSTLRALRVYMRADGAAPFYLGQGLDLVGGAPAFDDSPFAHDRQRTLNGACYADLVSRLWRRTRDTRVLAEFYPSVKANLLFTMRQHPAPEGILGLITESGDEWYECFDMRGITSHAGGVRLAQIRIVEALAEAIGDREFAAQCRQWFAQGSRLLEEQLWAGNYYFLSRQPDSQEINRLVLAFQFDGEWMAHLHGLPGVFRPERVRQALETIRRLNAAATDGGAVDVIHPDGRPDDIFLGRMGGTHSMPASVFILAMTYLYAGEKENGLKIAQRCCYNLVHEFGFTWNMPNVVNAAPGHHEWIYGSDYYQCLSLWALPAALKNQNLEEFTAPGGLIDRILQAGKGERPNE